MWSLISAMMSVLPVATEVLAVQLQPVPASFCWVRANRTGCWSPQRWAVGRAAGSAAWVGGEAAALQGCEARGGLLETELGSRTLLCHSIPQRNRKHSEKRLEGWDKDRKMAHQLPSQATDLA